MDFETIKFELKENGIGIITLNRPERLNALSLQMVEDLNEILDHLMINLDCRVVIIKGAGRAFCSGLDLKEAMILQKKKIPEEYKKFYYLDVPELAKAKIYYEWRLSHIITKMRKINQPIIAMIHGPAVGGGIAFTMAADIRIAGESARFNIGFINIGLSSSDIGSSYFLPRLIGLSRAAEIMYSGRFFEANEAEKIGYVLKVVPDDKLLDSAFELAEEMLNKSPLGLRMTKEAINLSLDCPSLETIIQIENRTQMICAASNDVLTAVQAKLEKKEPEFPLR